MDQRTPEELSSRRKLQNVPSRRARGGAHVGLRYVLGFGLALVIIAFAIIWFLNFNF